MFAYNGFIERFCRFFMLSSGVLLLYVGLDMTADGEYEGALRALGIGAFNWFFALTNLYRDVWSVNDDA